MAELAQYDDEQSPNNSSQEFTAPLPSNQLQHDLNGSIPASASSRVSGGTDPVALQGKPLEEILLGFRPFDSSQLSQAFEDEADRDAVFIREQFADYLQILLEFWAWNSARIAYTTQAESERLNERLNTITATERVQGMSDSVFSDSTGLRTTTARSCAEFFNTMCTRLQEFITRMTSAIDVLRGP